jgi:hopanoid biosynthesis associated protein HpnK
LKRLIVNADDLGLAETVNDGIVKGHRDGIITSASLLACGGAAAHAAELAAKNPGLGVGIHLCLTLERPVSDPKTVPTLVKAGKFYPGPLPLMARLVSGKISTAEIEAEFRAQVEKALSLGVTPDHIDGHQHVHMMPGVFEAVLKLAREYGIRAVRYPVGPWVGRMGYARTLEKFLLESLAASCKKKLRALDIKITDHFFGLAQTGALGVKALSRIIDGLPDGTSEIMCHPGLGNAELAKRLNWGRGWDKELRAVTDKNIKALLKEKQVELINYSAIKPSTF